MADFLLNPWELVLGVLTAVGLGVVIGFAVRGWFDNRPGVREDLQPADFERRLPSTHSVNSVNGERRRAAVRAAPSSWTPAAAGASGDRPEGGDRATEETNGRVTPNRSSKRVGAGEGATTVLVVDDRLDLRAIHSAYLEKHGYHVITAADGESALELAREYIPAVMLLDHSLPKRNGVEVARDLKRDPSTAGIPIVLMTAHSYGAVGSSAMAAGCTAFLSKPCDPSRVLQEVSRLAPAHGAGSGAT